MKKFKLKFLSLIFCSFMLLSVLTGCSLFVSNKDYGKDDVVMIVGEEKITKEELSQLYYSFYSQNSSYFYYYEDEQIADIFYRSVISNKIALQQAKALLDEGKLAITDEDYADIWENVFDYFYGQVDTAEKAILKSKGATDEDLPKRLQTSSSSSNEKAYKLENYEFEPVTVPEVGTNGTAPSVSDKIRELVEIYIFKYDASTVEDVHDFKDIDEQEKAVRTQAFDQFISSLILSAKANNKSTNKNEVIRNEVERVYKSYYESKLQEKYRAHVNAISLSENYFSDEAIAKKYENLLNASKENNSVEDNYVEIVSSTSNDTLVLYHYNGKYTFFSVQHLLVQYDAELLAELKTVEGYNTVRDESYREFYESYRESLIGGDSGILDMETSYRDENGFIVKDDEGNEVKVKISKILSDFQTEKNARLTALENGAEYSSLSPEEKELARQRVSTLLFNEYAWKYSDDTGSLTNDKLAGVLGYTISSQQNNHGSLVKDFANYARKMYEEVRLGTEKVGGKIGQAVTDYGVHLMMVTGVYDVEEVVSTEGKEASEVVAELKKTYVSNLSTQTLYQYVYDIIKNNTVGDNGTFYSDKLNKLVKEYEEAGKTKISERYSYEELNSLIK